MSETPWPAITQACLWVALDHGGVNRHRSQKKVRAEIAAWLAKQPPEMLDDIEPFFVGMTVEEFYDKCMGEETETAAYLAEHAPPFTDDLLTRYFDEVC